MKRIVVFNGSPRPSGNTAHMLNAFMDGSSENGFVPELFHTHKLNLKECAGCLRCNLLKRCSLSGDDWAELSKKIVNSDVLVFGSPIYFHHVPSSLKKLLDRFRSLVHVQITDSGLIYTPCHEWNKDIVLILSLGNPQSDDARGVIDLFKYISSIMGQGNRLHVITGTRLAMVNQVNLGEEELLALYKKLGLSDQLVANDFKKNQALLTRCRELGKILSRAI